MGFLAVCVCVRVWILYNLIHRPQAEIFSLMKKFVFAARNLLLHEAPPPFAKFII